MLGRGTGLGLWGAVTGECFQPRQGSPALCDKGEGLHRALNFWHGQRSFVALPNPPGSRAVTVHRGQWLCPVTNCSSQGVQGGRGSSFGPVISGENGVCVPACLTGACRDTEMFIATRNLSVLWGKTGLFPISKHSFERLSNSGGFIWLLGRFD